MEKFTVDYNELRKLDRNIIELYHQEATKRMDDLGRIESLITERGYKLFSIYYAIEIAVLGYVLAKLNDSINISLIQASMAIVIFTGISIFYTLKVIRPHDVMPAGREPKKLQIGKNNQIFKEHPFYDKYAYIMAAELMNLQHKIDKQVEFNEARTKLNNYSINFMLVGLVLAVIVFIISSIATLG